MCCGQHLAELAPSLCAVDRGRPGYASLAELYSSTRAGAPARLVPRSVTRLARKWRYSAFLHRSRRNP